MAMHLDIGGMSGFQSDMGLGPLAPAKPTCSRRKACASCSIHTDTQSASAERFTRREYRHIHTVSGSSWSMTVTSGITLAAAVVSTVALVWTCATYVARIKRDGRDAASFVLLSRDDAGDCYIIHNLSSVPIWNFSVRVRNDVVYASDGFIAPGETHAVSLRDPGVPEIRLGQISLTFFGPRGVQWQKQGNASAVPFSTRRLERLRFRLFV